MLKCVNVTVILTCIKLEAVIGLILRHAASICAGLDP